MRYLILLAVCAALACGQYQFPIPGGTGVTFGTATPGSCTEGTSGLFYNTTSHQLLYCGSGNTYVALGSSSMVYPSAGISVSTGAAWGSSLAVVTSVGNPGVDTNIATEKAVRAAMPTITGSGVLKGSSGNAVAAAVADIVALWESGSCSGFLKSDGTCGTSAGGFDTAGSYTLTGGWDFSGGSVTLPSSVLPSGTSVSGSDIAFPGKVTADSFEASNTNTTAYGLKAGAWYGADPGTGMFGLYVNGSNAPQLRNSSGVDTPLLTAVPAPGASTLGGVLTTACTGGQVADGYNNDGTPHCVTVSGASFDPLDLTISYQRERFVTGLTTSGNIGQSGMQTAAIGGAGTVAYIAGTSVYPGGLRLTTGATQNYGYSLAFGNGTNMTASMDFAMWSTKDWDVWLIVALGTNSTGLTNNQFRGGLGNVSATYPGSLGVYFRYDVGLSDTNFMVQICNASGVAGCGSAATAANTTVVDTGIAPVAGTHYGLHIRHRMSGVGSAETYYFAINGATSGNGYKTLCASGCDGTLTGAPTSAAGVPEVVYVSNASSSPARSIDVRFMGYAVTGLSPY